MSSQLVGAEMVEDVQLRALELAFVPDDGVRLCQQVVDYSTLMKRRHGGRVDLRRLGGPEGPPP